MDYDDASPTPLKLGVWEHIIIMKGYLNKHYKAISWILIIISCIGFIVSNEIIDKINRTYSKEIQDNMYESVSGLKVIVSNLEFEDSRLNLQMWVSIVSGIIFLSGIIIYLASKINHLEKRINDLENDSNEKSIETS